MNQFVSDFWTKARIARVTELFHIGWTGGRIANDIGATRNAVIGKMKRLKLKREGRNDPIPVVRKPRAVEQKPRVKIASVNSNSNAMRVQEHHATPYQPKTVDDVESRNIPLLELRKNDCRYPIGDPPLFCGHPKVEGSSYCGPHTRLCRGGFRY